MTSDWLCDVMLVIFKSALEVGEKRGRRKMRGEWMADLTRRAPHERRRIRGSEEGKKKKETALPSRSRRSETELRNKGRREFLPAALKVHWADNYMVFD